MSSTCNYIKVKLSTKDIESIERNLESLLFLAIEHRIDSSQAKAFKRTLTMFRKRVRNGIKEKAAKGPYKRTETYKK